MHALRLRLLSAPAWRQPSSRCEKKTRCTRTTPWVALGNSLSTPSMACAHDIDGQLATPHLIATLSDPQLLRSGPPSRNLGKTAILMRP